MKGDAINTIWMMIENQKSVDITRGITTHLQIENPMLSLDFSALPIFRA